MANDYYNWQVGMKVSLGPLGEPQSTIVELTEAQFDGFKTHNLINGLDGWVSRRTLNQIAELV